MRKVLKKESLKLKLFALKEITMIKIVEEPEIRSFLEERAALSYHQASISSLQKSSGLKKLKTSHLY